MSKLDKEYFIKHYETKLFAIKNDLEMAKQFYLKNPYTCDSKLIIELSCKISFYSDLLDVLKE